MAGHEEIRLEAKDGTVIGYFAPSMEWEQTDTSDIIQNSLPGPDNEAITIDLSRWTTELTIQGRFEDSTNLPPDHRQALLDLDSWTEPITAQQQVDRIRSFVRYNPSPPYNLYVTGREFTAANRSELDVANGVYPNVTLSEIRTPDEAGRTDEQYMFRFVSSYVES